MASGSRGSGTGAVSQALRLRRWIDIQLKDVLEERARGNWTEEDEREWRRTKPYECETCNERSSTRVSQSSDSRETVQLTRTGEKTTLSFSRNLSHRPGN